MTRSRTTSADEPLRIRVAGAPWHLAFATALPILQLVALNSNRLGLDNAVWSAAPVVVGVVLLWAILRWLVRNPRRADLLATALVFSVLGYGFVVPSPDFLYAWLIGSAVAVATLSLVPIDWSIPASLNVFFFLLVVSPTAKLLSLPFWSTRAQATRLALELIPDLPTPPTGASVDARDVYYVILDRYARGDQLRLLYGFDNEPFLGELEARGFFVARDSYSNYQRTAHSLASSLNTYYLDGLAGIPPRGASDWVPLYRLLEQARVPRFFLRQGYSFHFFGNWWEPTRRNPLADQNHNYRDMPEFLATLLRTSLLGDTGTARRFGLFDGRRHQHERIHRQLAELRELAAAPGPKLVLAHFLVPHPPFLFDRTGRFLDVETARERGRQASYVAQVEFINREILAWLDVLFSRPGPRPIIVIQADEGPAPARYAGEEFQTVGGDIKSVDWRDASPSALREKMGILNALYLPDRPKVALRPDISPVNAFRVILREYFGMPLELLPQRHYVYADEQHVYTFLSVDGLLSTPDPVESEAPPPSAAPAAPGAPVSGS